MADLRPLDQRINDLRKRFDGLIKYVPMLADHPDWSDDRCIEVAKVAHDLAVHRRKINPETWNSGIPYCRNIWREDLA